jgi:hypothetical protein
MHLYARSQINVFEWNNFSARTLLCFNELDGRMFFRFHFREKALYISSQLTQISFISLKVVSSLVYKNRTIQNKRGTNSFTDNYLENLVKTASCNSIDGWL